MTTTTCRSSWPTAHGTEEDERPEGDLFYLGTRLTNASGVGRYCWDCVMQGTLVNWEEYVLFESVYPT